MEIEVKYPVFDVDAEIQYHKDINNYLCDGEFIGSESPSTIFWGYYHGFPDDLWFFLTFTFLSKRHIKRALKDYQCSYWKYIQLRYYKDLHHYLFFERTLAFEIFLKNFLLFLSRRKWVNQELLEKFKNKFAIDLSFWDDLDGESVREVYESRAQLIMDEHMKKLAKRMEEDVENK